MASIVSYTKAALDSLLALKADATALASKADSSHIHDDRYFTETELNTALASKADSSHTHDDRYFTETELNTALAGKVSKAGDTMTGPLRGGTATDILGAVIEILRNNIQIGRLDNNAGGVRLQAQAGTLQLRGSNNTGISIDSAGVADFAVMPTVAGSAFPSGSLTILSDTASWFAPPGTRGNEYDLRSAIDTQGKSVPILLKAGTYNQMQIRVETAGAAGALIRLGVHDVLGNVLADFGTVVADSTGARIATAGTPLVLTTSGWYYLIAVLQGVTTTSPTIAGSGSVRGFGLHGSDLMYGPQDTGPLKWNSIAGAFPAQLSGRATAAGNPLITIRRSA